MDQWFGGGLCWFRAKFSQGPGQPESFGQIRPPEEQREAPQGKARVERGHEGARPPPRLA